MFSYQAKYRYRLGLYPLDMASFDPDESEPLLKRTEREGTNMEAEKKAAASRPMSRQQLMVVGCILMCELCERLTYYSVTANVVLFCTNTLKLESTSAATVSLVFSGKCFFFLSPLSILVFDNF